MPKNVVNPFAAQSPSLGFQGRLHSEPFLSRNRKEIAVGDKVQICLMPFESCMAPLVGLHC